MAQITVLVVVVGLCLTLFACSESAKTEPQSVIATEAIPESGASEIASMAIAPVDDVMKKWARSCALCHVTGEGGAPRSGFAEDWNPRLVNGKSKLLTHTIEGYNNMPPLGYCMSCEEEDFIALIDYMVGESP
jgi:cytochrome c5